MEIGQEFAAIQIRGGLLLAPLRPPCQPLEAVEIYRNIAEPAMGEIAD